MGHNDFSKYLPFHQKWKYFDYQGQEFEILVFQFLVLLIMCLGLVEMSLKNCFSSPNVFRFPQFILRNCWLLFRRKQRKVFLAFFKELVPSILGSKQVINTLYKYGYAISYNNIRLQNKTWSRMVCS